MTKREYNIEAHFRVPYATTVVAESAEIAWSSETHTYTTFAWQMQQSHRNLHQLANIQVARTYKSQYHRRLPYLPCH